MSLFRCLGRTKVSVQVRGSFCEYFVTKYILIGRSCYHLAQPPSWRTTPRWLSAAAYSIYSQLPSILEVVHPSATRGCAMPCWQGPKFMVLRFIYLSNHKIKKMLQVKVSYLRQIYPLHVYLLFTRYF